uniref:Protein kinase domain-containing protein n=1 Tax=Daphnia galeata TaxID=27404 RepID=A0A8J2RPF8_9CRUS|nr:unnamed protein product [Daphnia galeata]
MSGIKIGKKKITATCAACKILSRECIPPIGTSSMLTKDGRVPLSCQQNRFATAASGTYNEISTATLRSLSGAKESVDSCNFNSPASERAFPSKLVPFELGHNNPSVKVRWNTPSPAQPSNPSPQYGLINGILPRRDSESSAFSEALSASAMSNIPPIDEQELSIVTIHWNMVSILEKGGFGTVYKGTWKNTQVAIKRMENQSMGERRYEECQYTVGQEFRARDRRPSFCGSISTANASGLVHQKPKNGPK